MVDNKLLTVRLFNAGSLGTKQDDFVATILRHQADVIAINETWLKIGEEGRAPSVPNYCLRHIPRPVGIRGGRGGGAGFYVRRGLNARTCKHPDSPITEQMWLKLKMNNNTIIIGTAYRPPWLDTQTFLNALMDTIGSFSKYDHIILLGDFNINILNPSDAKVNILNTFLVCTGLKQVVTEPTHFTESSCSLIDVVCTDASVRSVSIDSTGSIYGHAFVRCTLSMRKPYIKPRYIKYRSIADINPCNFNKDVEFIKWDRIKSRTDIDDIVQDYTNTLIYLYDLHAPLKTRLVKELPAPWLTCNVRLMMRLRNAALTKYRRTKNCSHRDYYKSLKKQVEIALYYEKKCYYDQHINSQINNPKRLWKNLKSKILPSQPFELPSHLNNPDLINNYFLKVPGDPKVSISSLTFFEFQRFRSVTFSLRPVEPVVIAKVIKDLHSNAEGIDGVTLDMISLLAPQTLDVITCIVNKSIQDSKFPTGWKTAVVRPIPKKSNVAEVKDLRPISILPCLSKILEKVVAAQLNKYLEANNILPDVQSGFRRQRSTATAVMDVIDDILTAQDEVSSASCQLLFLMEPPPRLSFSNSTGARVSCAAHGTPAPVISWLTEDGAPVSDVPGLRSALQNGTLWLGTFSAAQYRSDVHAAVYRCRAASNAGTILSRDMRLEAVMDIPWEVRVQSSHGVAGGAALLTCTVPSTVRHHITVTRWFKDGSVLAPLAAEAGGRYIVGGSRSDILVVRDARPDDVSSYSCEAQHALTGEKRRSAPSMVTVSHATSSMAPRMLTVSEDEMVPQGGDIRLVCCAIGSPPPTYSWFRHSNGRLNPVSNSIRISVSDQVLIIRRAQLSDGGVWTCRAHNQFGEQRRDARLRVRSRLVVSVHPQLQVANSGSSVSFNCSVEGGDARVRWLHDGVPVGGGERVLRVHGVVRAHRGMYQCFAERDLDSAQAAAELRLGDTAPELHYTFIEQALHPGPALALHCAASGSPPPRFTWLLDGQPVEEHNTPQRTITQFMNTNGDIVSYLNLTSVRPDDGGRYTCRAHNSRGAVEHSTRLNVYGPPSIRSIGPVRVVAGVNTTIFCPYSGFPISEIRWQRGGMDLSSSGGRALSGVGGELLLWPAEPADAGVYSCRVSSPAGQYAQKDVQIFVRNPPKIAGFTFPTDLVEGSSIQVLCGITSGDKPVYFSWLKDGQHIPSTLQVQEKSLDEFSFLIFSHVTSKHSGDYTCVASNSAAEVNHTARLAVKVAPSWVYEPQDVSALLGTQILVHCATKGYPEPRISWLKGHGSSVDFRIVSNLDLQFSVLPNGSLSIAPAAHHHEGQYMCRAENGIGRGLSKIIAVSVNEPAHFEFSSRNMTVKRTAQATLQCDARGDPPIQLQWTHNMKRVDLTTYRVSVSEKRSESGVSSQLSIAHAERQDSGVYRCRAENAFGRDELLIYLAVQEFPEAPVGLHVSHRSGRGATISWRKGYDGNARVLLFRLQYRVVGDARRPDAGDWADAPTRDVSADRVAERQDPDSSTDINLEYRVEGLRPATAYALRLAAVNAIGDSDYSDPVIVQTLEEAPSEPPHNVQVQATAPGELLVKWQAPPQETWNGELLGYVISWHELSAVDNRTSTLTAPGWGAAHALLVALRTNTQYTVRVNAFNAVGAGPGATLTATTLEGAPEASPERVRCEPLSAQSIRVWWEPPPLALRGGVLLGYEVLYETVDELESQVETRRSGAMETVLQALQRAANYSIAVRARTAAGIGPTSEPVYCITHEDIPGAPMDIKAIANSEDTVIVSWLAPLQKNGKIKHYTVYNRPQRTGQHSQMIVHHKEDEEEYQVEVRGLQEHQVYEFWVTAATASGEGEMSAIVAKKPSSRAPAKITSFGRRIEARWGARARLRCGAAGTPPPHRAWSRRRPAPPLLHDNNYLVDGPYLVILNVDRNSADNYTCTVRNPWGEERSTWELRVLAVPGRPVLRLAAAAPARLHLVWEKPTTGGSNLHGYVIEHSRSDDIKWHSIRLPADARSYTLERLSCGTLYKVRLMAYNVVGPSPHSDELVVSTKGGPSKAASEKDLITTNSSCVRLNLLTWDSNGCPLSQFVVSVRSFEESAWVTQTVSPAAQPTVMCGLLVATWYHLKVVATSAAGTTVGNYYFSTLTESGERIPAPAHFPPGGEEGEERATAVLAAAACGLLAALLLLAALAYKRSPATTCFRKGYEQGDISEEEDKSVEKRDNKRNCQQVYTSSPIKHPVCKKDQQVVPEMYEISPYATFSMSGGAGGATVTEEAAAGGTLRTFGRGEPAPLQAAPPRAHPHHHAHNAADEYTLSRAMTLMVRRSESDSDSSGSPCAECNSSVSYRMPVTPGKEEVFRAVTDSSAESADARSVRLHNAAGAVGADKARRRARRHHAPTSSRYQQRQEQERRDFTIHV